MLLLPGGGMSQEEADNWVMDQAVNRSSSVPLRTLRSSARTKAGAGNYACHDRFFHRVNMFLLEYKGIQSPQMPMTYALHCNLKAAVCTYVNMIVTGPRASRWATPLLHQRKAS